MATILQQFCQLAEALVEKLPQYEMEQGADAAENYANWREGKMPELLAYLAQHPEERSSETFRILQASDMAIQQYLKEQMAAAQTSIQEIQAERVQVLKTHQARMKYLNMNASVGSAYMNEKK